jgi:hypothetical protein
MDLRVIRRILCLAVLFSGCGAPSERAPRDVPPTLKTDGAGVETAPVSEECWVPVAHHLGTDRKTGDRIAVLLRNRGIESVSAGSAGYTIAVPCKDAERARQILRQAILDEGLQAGVKEQAKRSCVWRRVTSRVGLM